MKMKMDIRFAEPVTRRTEIADIKAYKLPDKWSILVYNTNDKVILGIYIKQDRRNHWEVSIAPLEHDLPGLYRKAGDWR
jgi:hypothetical protein